MMKSLSPATTVLFDRFLALGSSTAADVVARANGAAYLLAPGQVARNTQRLLSSVREQYQAAVMGYSYKTNYEAEFIQAARKAGAWSEVVSIHEYRYAKMLGVEDAQIVFNGPGKTPEILREVLYRDLTLLVDSVAELETIERIAQETGLPRARLGIRVSPQLSFQKHPSRFGIDLGSSAEQERLRAIERRGILRVDGLHLHYVGDRSAESFEERLRYLLRQWKSLEIGPLGFIDCGGGFASAMPEELRVSLPYRADSLEDYGHRLGSVMREIFPAGGVQLILEPGTGILADAGLYVTPVLDVKVVAGQSIAVVDGTYFCMNPLRSTAKPCVARIRPSSASTARVAAPVKVCGNSCMEIDVLDEAFPEEIAVGDILVFGQKGAYASCMATPFIQGIPAVVVLDDNDEIHLARPRTDEDLLAQLHGAGIQSL
jgi:diaminopimelate decarboxylase